MTILDRAELLAKDEESHPYGYGELQQQARMFFLLFGEEMPISVELMSVDLKA